MGEQVSQKCGGGINIDATPEISVYYMFLYTILWYNAVIARSSKSDSAGNTEVRPILSNLDIWVLDFLWHLGLDSNFATDQYY